MPTEGGAAVQVTRKGGSSPQESMDGKSLFYLKPKQPEHDEHDELWMLPVDGGEESRVLEDVLRTDYDIKQKGIYFAADLDSKGIQFLFYNFATRKAQPVVTIDRDVRIGFTVSGSEWSDPVRQLPDAEFLNNSKWAYIY